MRMTARRTLLLALPLLLSIGGSAVARPKKKAADAPASDMAPLPDKAPAGAAANPNALNSLTVVCSPTGADVFVDGQNIGKAPIDLPVPVTNGTHSLKVSHLGFAPFIDTFTAKPGKQVKLEVELVPVAGVLHVSSSVAGSRVLIDGRYVGEVPLDVEMDVGARAIQVEKGCYKEFFQNLLAVAGKEETLDVKLDELPQNETNPCYVKPLPPPKWFQKKWVWGVLAGAAVLVAGAIVVAATVRPPGFLDPADVLYDKSMPMSGALLSW
jgi:hypothetical protein